MKTRRLTNAAIVAAIYSALTLIQTMLFPELAFGPIQVRLAEALTVLPLLMPEAVPGLFVGCLLSNTVGAAMGVTTMLDIIVGPLATLAAALLTSRARKVWLAPLPPVLVNAVVIGLMLSAVYTPEAVWASFPVFAGEIAIGQTLACYGCGVPLLMSLKRLNILKKPDTDLR